MNTGEGVRLKKEQRQDLETEEAKIWMNTIGEWEGL